MSAMRLLICGLLGIQAGLACARELPGRTGELLAMAQARGVEQDYAEAYRLYCRAAALGDAHAAFSIGWMYFDGRGLPLKPDLALGWFQKAAAGGDATAKRVLLRFRNSRVRPAADPNCPVGGYLQSSGTAVLRLVDSPNRKRVEALVKRVAAHYAIDPQLVLAVIQMESGFNPAAHSPKNAQGLMQLIPATAERFGVKDVWNPLENIRGGTAYLHWLLRHFGGDVKLVLAAYNAGERTVEQYRGVPPFDETQNYVRQILDYYGKAMHPIPPQRLADELS